MVATKSLQTLMWYRHPAREPEASVYALDFDSGSDETVAASFLLER